MTFNRACTFNRIDRERCLNLARDRSSEIDRCDVVYIARRPAPRHCPTRCAAPSPRARRHARVATRAPMASSSSPAFVAAFVDVVGGGAWRPSLVLRNDHDCAVKSVSLRRAVDGERAGDVTLVSASADGEIRVRVAATRGAAATTTTTTTVGVADADAEWRPLARLRGHDGSVKAVRAVGARCDRVLSASYDRSARLWTLPSTSSSKSRGEPAVAAPPRLFRGHGDYVVDAAFANDDTFGEIIITTSSDGFIRVWDAETETLLTSVDVRDEGVGAATCVDVCRETSNGAVVDAPSTPDDCVIASGLVDGSIRFYHVQSGSCALVLLGHLGAVTGIAAPEPTEDEGARTDAARLLPAHTRVCYGCKNGMVGAFALGSQSDGQSVEVEYLMRKYPARADAELEGVACAKFMRSYSSTILASSSEDRTVRIWDVQRGSCLHVLTGQVPACIECVSMIPSTLACGGSDGSVFVWRAVRANDAADVALSAQANDAKTLTTRADIALRWLMRKGPQVLVDELADDDEALLAAAYESADDEARALITVDPNESFIQDKVCTICHESRVAVKGDVSESDAIVVQLPCRHCFHASCVLSWMAVSHQCPNCREVNYDSGLPHVMACVDIDRHRSHALVRAP